MNFVISRRVIEILDKMRFGNEDIIRRLFGANDLKSLHAFNNNIKRPIWVAFRDFDDAGRASYRIDPVIVNKVYPEYRIVLNAPPDHEYVSWFKDM